MNKPRYIAHYGKGQPVGDWVEVEMVWREGVMHQGRAGDYVGWERGAWGGWHSPTCDIIAYRVLDDE